MVGYHIGISCYGIRSSSYSPQHLNEIALIERIRKVHDNHADVFDGNASFQDSSRKDETVFLFPEIFDMLLSFRQIRIDIGTGKETGKDLVEDFAVMLAGGEDDALVIHLP